MTQANDTKEEDIGECVGEAPESPKIRIFVVTLCSLILCIEISPRERPRESHTSYSPGTLVLENS